MVADMGYLNSVTGVQFPSWMTPQTSCLHCTIAQTVASSLIRNALLRESPFISSIYHKRTCKILKQREQCLFLFLSIFGFTLLLSSLETCNVHLFLLMLSPVSYHQSGTLPHPVQSFTEDECSSRHSVCRFLISKGR